MFADVQEWPNVWGASRKPAVRVSPGIRNIRGHCDDPPTPGEAKVPYGRPSPHINQRSLSAVTPATITFIQRDHPFLSLGYLGFGVNVFLVNAFICLVTAFRLPSLSAQHQWRSGEPAVRKAN